MCSFYWATAFNIPVFTCKYKRDMNGSGMLSQWATAVTDLGLAHPVSARAL